MIVLTASKDFCVQRRHRKQAPLGSRERNCPAGTFTQFLMKPGQIAESSIPANEGGEIRACLAQTSANAAFPLRLSGTAGKARPASHCFINEFKIWSLVTFRS
jgi:hypothetical protein